MARPRTRGRSKARSLRRQWLRLAVRRQPPSQCQWQWWCRWRRLRWMLQAQPNGCGLQRAGIGVFRRSAVASVYSFKRRTKPFQQAPSCCRHRPPPRRRQRSHRRRRRRRRRRRCHSQHFARQQAELVGRRLPRLPVGLCGPAVGLCGLAAAAAAAAAARPPAHLASYHESPILASTTSSTCRSRTGWISAMLLKLVTPPGLRNVD